MAAKPKPPAIYSPIPTEPNPNPTYYVVLPLYADPRRVFLRRVLLFLLCLFVLSLSVFLLWPSDPDLQLVRFNLNHIQVRSWPSVSLDLSLSLSLRVRNRAFFSLDYRSLNASLAYRGKELGFAESQGGHIRARGASYVDANLVLDGFRLMEDFFYLVEDVAAGSVPFDAVSRVRGELGFLFFFKIPIQAKVSCEVYINPMSQTIIHEYCFPK